MKERPILFSAPMVRAILEGRKTQTRRVVKLGAHTIDSRSDGSLYVARTTRPRGVTSFEVPCPYGAPGDRLWVKESHQVLNMRSAQIVAYRATCFNDTFTYVDPNESTIEGVKVNRWRPSIHMRREWSRLELEVSNVRVERLHAITEDDAKAEGIDCHHHALGAAHPTYLASFRWLWSQINGVGSWPSNPWVWVVEFRRVSELRNGAEVGSAEFRTGAP